MEWNQELVGPRVVMRPPQGSDIPGLYEDLCSLEPVAHFLTWLPHTSVDVTEEIVRNIQIANSDGGEMTWVIEVAGQPSGLLTCWHDDETGVELGFCISPKHQRKGYMSEAVSLVLGSFSSVPWAERVWATTDVDNVPSQRLLESVGFVRRERLTEHVVHPNISPDPRDSYLYTLEDPS